MTRFALGLLFFRIPGVLGMAADDPLADLRPTLSIPLI